MGSFKVCGQDTDNLDTKWNETDECSITSLFLVVKLIINFLFKFAFMLLPVLALTTGGMFYLGMNGKDTIPTVKRVWKYAGIGCAIMFMSWLLVSWLLAATGFNAIQWYQAIIEQCTGTLPTPNDFAGSPGGAGATGGVNGAARLVLNANLPFCP